MKTGGVTLIKEAATLKGRLWVYFVEKLGK
jgi:hypothetical protein